jgi:hypothetical protein
MKVNASAELERDCISNFSLDQLERFLANYSVTLLSLRFIGDKVSVMFRGTKENLRLAVKSLYLKSGSSFKKTVPEHIKNYLDSMADSQSYKKSYDKVASDYIRYCTLNNLTPHPEVDEGFVY